MCDKRTKEKAIEIGNRLKEYRTERDWNQKYVAEAIGITFTTVSRYESGTVVNIPYGMIEELSELFEVSPCELMGWK